MSRNSYVKIQNIKQGSRAEQEELTYKELALLKSALEQMTPQSPQEEKNKEKLKNKLSRL